MKTKYAALLLVFLFCALLLALPACQDGNDNDEKSDKNDDSPGGNQERNVGNFVVENNYTCETEYLSDEDLEDYFIDKDDNIHLLIAGIPISGQEVYYAVNDGSQWQFEQLFPDEIQIDLSLFVDDSGTVHIANWDSSTESCYHTVQTQNGWSSELITNYALDYPLFLKIFVESDGEVVVFYYSEGGLYENRKVGQNWFETLVIENIDSVKDIAIDSEDQYHALFTSVEDTSLRLHYANSKNWVPETVHEYDIGEDGYYEMNAAITVNEFSEPFAVVSYDDYYYDRGPEASKIVYYTNTNSTWNGHHIQDLHYPSKVDIVVDKNVSYVAFNREGSSLYRMAINSNGKMVDFVLEVTYMSGLRGFMLDQSDNMHFLYHMYKYIDSDEKNGLYHVVCY